MAKLDDDDEIGDINIVPLVDVMLVLLTIVLMTATFVVNGRIPVDLARAEHAPPSQQAPQVITVTAHQRLYVNDQLLVGGMAALPDALRAWPKDQPVVVRADASLALGRFVEVVDRVKALGHTQVSLEVKRS